MAVLQQPTRMLLDVVNDRHVAKSAAFIYDPGTCENAGCKREQNRGAMTMYLARRLQRLADRRFAFGMENYTIWELAVR